MKGYNHKKGNRENSSHSFESSSEKLDKNPLYQLYVNYEGTLSILNGSGDSVFEVLRPLVAVKLYNSDSEFESSRNPDSDSNQSAISGDDESLLQGINYRSVEILSTSTSEKSLSQGNIADGRNLNMDPEEQAPESEAPPDDTAESEPAPDAAPDAEEPPPPAQDETPEMPPEGDSPEPAPEELEAVTPLGETSEEEPPPTQPDIGRTSTISNIPVTDSAVLAELKEADEKALKTAMLIEAMRKSIAEYNDREELSEEDARNLEIKQNELMGKLAEFEEITKRVQQLVGLADLSSVSLQSAVDRDKETGVKPQQLGIITEARGTEAPGREMEELTELLSPEDKLPKVVVCGIQDQVPRIIVCDGLKKKRSQSARKNMCKKDCPNLMSLTGRLNESYCLQERLATENADLEGMRYSLEEALLCKDNDVDCLQKKVGNLQLEMKVILKENNTLREKLTNLSEYSSCPGSYNRPQNVQSNYPCSTQNVPQALGPPGDMGCRIQQYSSNTCQLECQLNQIESEVKHMQCELGQLQRERQQLEQQRKMVKSPLPLNTCFQSGSQSNSPRDANCNSQLRELREQYNRLQDDFKSKVTEVASLRNENVSLRQVAEAAKEAQSAAEAAAQELEGKYKTNEVQSKMLIGSKEQLIEQEQQLNVARQRFREAQDELDELRSVVQDQSAQLEDYKNKYIQAQEQVEEQRRKIELLEMDNCRISEQVNLELQRIKNQFQEKLQELTPLPDLLTATQIKLKESQQLKAIAEQNLEEMARELQDAKEQVAALQRDMHDSRTSMQFGSDEKAAMRAAIENWEKKYNELKEENTNMKANLARLEEAANQSQIRLQEKLHEIAQLTAQLETVREESARQVSRTKDRSETVRRSLQSQIFELEKELAQSRAAARSAQKDRDEIRQRMQSQINNLTDNFDQAQLRIRSLQSHVNFLKTSYTDLYGQDKPNLMLMDTNTGYGMDTCDCNF